VTVGKTLSAVAALGVLLVVMVHGASGGVAATSATTQVAVVASVYDGDTLSLRDGRRVRLLQIDTPELGSGECYSRAARTALLGLAPPGRRVVLETDPALDRVDRYGRILRYLKRNGINVNLELARRGAAAPYFYRGDRGRYAGSLMRAAQSAKAAKLGLWKACPFTVLDPDRAVETGRSGPPATQTPAPNGRCDPNYSGGCVPPPPPDLDCADIRALGIAPVRVIGSDPHRLDGDDDGLGCE
jgi:micrococcal nuclease